MNATRSGEQDYALSNAWELARRRLALLEAIHDPATFRRMETLGVRRHWSCLEAGAGYGSVARWLAGRVGERGSVTLLEEIEAPGLEVRRTDVSARTISATRAEQS